jgi:hypothetical protein
VTKKNNCEQIIGILEKHNYFCSYEAETVDNLAGKITRKACAVAEEVVIDSIEGGIGA